MIVNAANLRTLYTSFSTAYQGGFSGVAPLYPRVALTVPSTTRAQEYGWLGEFPQVREWIGDRVVRDLDANSYTIRNREFESTVSVKAPDIEDDNVGLYVPMFQELGRSAAAFPDVLAWSLLKAGFSSPCYDKQYFFDTDHPVLDENGQTVSVANTDGGAGAPWFLVDASRAIKPIVYQTRRAFDLVRMDAATDEVVFRENKARYGTYGRCNVGFGFWQLAWGSKQTLNAANYAAARAAMQSFKGDYGRPLGVMPNLLIVPPALESAGRKLVNSENASGGETNEWKGTAELLVVPWLA